MLGQATGRGGEGVGSLTDVQLISYAPRSLRAARLWPAAGRSSTALQVIALERPGSPAHLQPEHAPEPVAKRRETRSGRLRAWAVQVPSGGPGVAVFLTVALLASTAGGAGLLEGGIAVDLQARAAAVHQSWAAMRADGIPDSELAALEQEWIYSQKVQFLGVGSVFWWPGASGIVDRWQSVSAAIYARDLVRYRADAFAADQNLHAALGSEPWSQRKARLDALATATRPDDFAALRSDWDLEAKLVPIDRNIAAAAGALATQVLQATGLGIRSDPAPAVMTRAGDYTNLGALERMARAEFLTRALISTRKDLQGRLDAATVTQQAFGHADDEISGASLYGIGVAALQARIDAGRAAYGNATTVAEFARVTGVVNQVAADALSAINVALSTTHIISGVTFYYQDHALSCEEAATSMALTHQGINLSQDQILSELGADRRTKYVDSSGRVRWGNPYETFVGNVDGSESNFTGYGTYYPPLVRIARAHGARIIAYGSMSAATVYARVIAGHPVVAFATWDWAWHPRHDYLSFDGQWIPFIGPYNASHVYTVVGVSPSSVLIDDPIRGQYWISKASFQAGYSDFNVAIVFA